MLEGFGRCVEMRHMNAENINGTYMFLELGTGFRGSRKALGFFAVGLFTMGQFTVKKKNLT